MKIQREPIDLVALFDSLLFAGLVAALLYRAVPDPNRELVAAAAGFIAGWVSAARNHRYGSSAGADQKNRALADQASALAQAAPAAAKAAAAGAGGVGAGGTVRAEGDLTLSPASPSEASPSAGSGHETLSGTAE